MSTKSRKKYSREFKLEALKLAERAENSMSQVERDLGIPKGLLNKWKRKQTREGGDAFRGQGRLTQADQQLRELRRENELLRQEREILKKAIAIFTQNQS